MKRRERIRSSCVLGQTLSQKDGQLTSFLFSALGELFGKQSLILLKWGLSFIYSRAAKLVLPFCWVLSEVRNPNSLGTLLA